MLPGEKMKEISQPLLALTGKQGTRYCATHSVWTLNISPASATISATITTEGCSALSSPGTFVSCARCDIGTIFITLTYTNGVAHVTTKFLPDKPLEKGEVPTAGKQPIDRENDY